MNFFSELFVLHFLTIQLIYLFLKHVLVKTIITNQIVWICYCTVCHFLIIWDLRLLRRIYWWIPRVSVHSLSITLLLRYSRTHLRIWSVRVSGRISAWTGLLRYSTVKWFWLIFKYWVRSKRRVLILNLRWHYYKKDNLNNLKNYFILL